MSGGLRCVLRIGSVRSWGRRAIGLSDCWANGRRIWQASLRARSILVVLESSKSACLLKSESEDFAGHGRPSLLNGQTSGERPRGSPLACRLMGCSDGPLDRRVAAVHDVVGTYEAAGAHGVGRAIGVARVGDVAAARRIATADAVVAADGVARSPQPMRPPQPTGSHQLMLPPLPYARGVEWRPGPEPRMCLLRIVAGAAAHRVGRADPTAPRDRGSLRDRHNHWGVPQNSRSPGRRLRSPWRDRSSA